MYTNAYMVTRVLILSGTIQRLDMRTAYLSWYRSVRIAAEIYRRTLFRRYLSTLCIAAERLRIYGTGRDTSSNPVPLHWRRRDGRHLNPRWFITTGPWHVHIPAVSEPSKLGIMMSVESEARLNFDPKSNSNPENHKAATHRSHFTYHVLWLLLVALRSFRVWALRKFVTLVQCFYCYKWLPVEISVGSFTMSWHGHNKANRTCLNSRLIQQHCACSKYFCQNTF